MNTIKTFVTYTMPSFANTSEYTATIALSVYIGWELNVQYRGQYYLYHDLHTGYNIRLHRAVTLEMHCTVESLLFYIPFEQYVYGGGLIWRAQNDNRLIHQTATNRLPVLFHHVYDISISGSVMCSYLLYDMYLTPMYDNWHSLTV